MGEVKFRIKFKEKNASREIGVPRLLGCAVYEGGDVGF